ncbi:MAG TPA: amidase [Halobacteriales archaeon]|nr:amidase [Halobacteriales archaeon]
MSDDLPFLPAAELADRIRRRELSPVEATEAYLDRIEARNDHTNAYVTVVEERAMAQAREAEEALDAGRPAGPLCGVPVAIKDLQHVGGVRNTYGSPFFADFVPEESSPLVRRLEAAGAVVLGKTNTPEFGFKSTTDNPLFGATSTPFDPEHTSGGSSGGSAAAVADGLAAFAQGSDGGGSIRIPAACCGIYGHKPSFGLVPKADRPDGFGHHTPFTFLGPLTRTVEDAALALSVMAGPDPSDPHSLPAVEGDYRAATTRPVDDLRVAYSPDLSMYPIDPGVRDAIDATADAIDEAGATVERIDFAEESGLERSWQELDDAFGAMWMASFAAMAERLEEERGIDYLGEDRDEATPGLPMLMEMGEEIDAKSYLRVNEIRTEFYDALRSVLADYDALVTPTLSVTPPGKHGPGPEEVDGHPIDRYTGWLLTWLFNMTPNPVASVPAGLVDGLPVGMQVVGRRFADDTVFALGAAVERVRPWRDTYEQFR